MQAAVLHFHAIPVPLLDVALFHRVPSNSSGCRSISLSKPVTVCLQGVCNLEGTLYQMKVIGPWS